MPATKNQRIASWILSAIIVAFLLFSASAKFMRVESMPQGVAENISRLGWNPAGMLPIGILEVACAVLLLVPRTAFVGAILLTGYLGGATATHVRIGDPFFLPVILGVLVWFAYGLRRPDIVKGAFSKG